MKTLRSVFIIALFGALPFTSQAAPHVLTASAGQQPNTEISATGSTTLISLESQLGEKPLRGNRTSFHVVSTSIQNRLHGISDIYN